MREKPTRRRFVASAVAASALTACAPGRHAAAQAGRPNLLGRPGRGALHRARQPPGRRAAVAGLK